MWFYSVYQMKSLSKPRILLLILTICDAAILPYKQPRTQNVPGNMYVDESCIDCDVCRWMCPTVFSRKGIKSIVSKQPDSQEERLQAFAAMVACPVGSIRTRIADPMAKEAVDIFPSEIDPVSIPNVMHLGYHSSESFAATPYFIKRQLGNVMVDTPRFNSRLASAIEQEGGLRYIILTHRDDIADCDKWQKRFPESERIIHRTEAFGVAKDAEIKLEGEGIWNPAEDIQIIHTPGHTAGSICILFKTNKESVLFSGDHIGYSFERKRLDGFKRFNHGNVDVQAATIRMLASTRFPFTWILPGHGRMARFASLEEKEKAITKAADEFEEESEYDGILSIGYQ